jgi:hypothetical protein
MATSSLRRRNLRRRRQPPPTIFRWIARIHILHWLASFAAVIWTYNAAQIHRYMFPACSPTTFAECREGRW